MLTYEDCIGLSGLTVEEVAAIARHEHLPEIVALEMGWRLCRTPEGERLIRRMILDDIDCARRRCDARTAAELERVLLHFVDAHSGCEAMTPQVRERVAVYLAAMMRHFGLDHAALQERVPSRMQATELRCALCTETERCRRFLAGAAGREEQPSAFCPNAPLFEELALRRLTA